jgi:hypothetical protein
MDQAYALAMGRNPYIAEDVWDVPLISVRDLEPSIISTSQAPWTLHQRARTFVEKARPCGRFGAMKSAYSPLASAVRRDDRAYLEGDYEVDLINFVYNGIEPRI